MGPTGPGPEPGYLDRAKVALNVVDELGDLSDDERVKWMAVGTSPGQYQQAYLLHAATLALMSIAESLEALARERAT
jgi:hypothetical protein